MAKYLVFSIEVRYEIADSGLDIGDFNDALATFREQGEATIIDVRVDSLKNPPKKPHGS